MSLELEGHFNYFAVQTVGLGKRFDTPYGPQPLVYADWAASGRLYYPIERYMLEEVGPYVANTHTETNITGSTMTNLYSEARQTIKEHVGADEQDVLVMAGSGMTGALARFQQVLGWRIPERFAGQITIPEEQRPVVFVSEAEHHSNDISWRETIADVEIIPGDPYEIVSLGGLAELLQQYRGRQTKLAAVTAGSNVTGIRPPIHEVAQLMHEQGGYCTVDYTCAAPYDQINMHPGGGADLDAVFLSPHKALGGPGSAGVAVFNRDFYGLSVPTQPGGGTVKWTNPFNERRYYSSESVEGIEAREDGGTPPFLQTIRAAEALRLKEEMGVSSIARREAEICSQVFEELHGVEGVHVLAAQQRDRLPVFALDFDQIHYNAAVQLLNDRFGVQVRGGCACAGTYGHRLFDIGQEQSKAITDDIDRGVLASKPGFVRASYHPTMNSKVVSYTTAAIAEVAVHGQEWLKADYVVNRRTMEYHHRRASR